MISCSEGERAGSFNANLVSNGKQESISCPICLKYACVILLYASKSDFGAVSAICRRPVDAVES